MSKQNLNYEDGIPEEILWNPENNSFMKRSLFPGKWIPARISVWDADNPRYQYQPGRDRTYQEAMKNVSGNPAAGEHPGLQDHESPSRDFGFGTLSKSAQSGTYYIPRPGQKAAKTTPGNMYAARQQVSPNAAQPPVSQNSVTPEKNYGWEVLTKSPQLSTFVVPEPPRPRPGIEYSVGEGPLKQDELELKRADKEPGGFNDQVAKVLESEGGYVNSRYDRGGATNHGISSSTWNAFAKKHIGVEPTVENLKQLTPEGAKKIYKEEFWKPSKVGEINDPVIRQLYFDFYINSGRDAAVKNLQRAINQLGGQVDVDGFIGSETIEALNRYPNPGGIYEQYKKNRIDNYHKIVNNNKSQKEFLNGWINRMDKFKSYDEMLKQY